MNTHLRSAVRSCLVLLAAIGAFALPPPALSAARSGEKLIISGASGQLGLLAIQELLRRGVDPHDLILVSRTPEKLAEYAAMGASTRYGDVDHPDSLPAAFAGGHRMLMISLGISPGAGPRPPRHKLAFDAAVKAGVRHIVYTSFIGADEGGNMLADDHRQSEEYLRASGAKWTALRNGLYADGLVNQALQAAASGRIMQRKGEVKAAPVTRADCAAAAAGALLGGAKVEDRAFDITGPALVDTHDVAAIITRITGRKIEVVPQDTPALPLKPLVTPAVTQLTGHRATSVRALLEAHRAELVAAARAAAPVGGR